MHRNISYLLSALLTILFLASSSCDKNDKVPDSGELPDPIEISLRGEEVEMLQADQQFAFDFFTRLYDEERAGKDRNFMISPLSLSMALAATRNGAAGETEVAMTETLKLTPFGDEEAINSYYDKLREALLATDPSTKLSIANLSGPTNISQSSLRSSPPTVITSIPRWRLSTSATLLRWGASTNGLPTTPKS